MREGDAKAPHETEGVLSLDPCLPPPHRTQSPSNGAVTTFPLGTASYEEPPTWD